MMANFYYIVATAYVQQGQTEAAIDYLNQYVSVCKSFEFPARLRGDEFFDMVENKFDLFDIGTVSPRDEKSVKASMIAAVKDNPIFMGIKEQSEFKNMIKQLELL